MPKKPRRKSRVTVRALRRELLQQHVHLQRALGRIGQLESMVRWYKRVAARDYAVVGSRQRVPPADPREVEMNWAVYDQIDAAITANERALFEASPAYQKYQQWRKTGGMVKTGDWRAP